MRHLATDKPFKKGLHKFHTPLYRELLMNVVPLRKEYRRVEDIGARKEMAKKEFDFWNGYLEARKAEVKQLEEKRIEMEEDVESKEAHKSAILHYTHSIPPGDIARLKEYFDRYKDRKTYKLAAEMMTEFLGEYSKTYRFKAPLHPKNLSQLVHPFHGYLNAYKGRQFSFEDLLVIFENQITASHEKEHGRELLGDELSCLSFWLIQDESQKGWLTLEEFKGMLYAFRFDHLFFDQYGKPDDVLTMKKLKKEFKFNLQGKLGEILLPAQGTVEANEKDKHAFVRFDFIRDVFLERGL